MKKNYIIICILFLLSGLIGCTAETEIGSDIEQYPEQGKEAQAIFNLAIPSQGTPTATRAMVDDSEIKSFTIWVFDGWGDDATLLKQVETKDAVIREVNGIMQLFVLLPETDSQATVCMIANSSVSAPNQGITKKAALQQLTYSIAAGQPLSMPMYGEQKFEKIQQGMKQSSISLRRAMAKIEVDIRDAYNQFELQEVKLLNINSQGYVYPAKNVIESTYTYTQQFSVSQKEDNIFTCYIPEVLDLNNVSKRVSILLKGIYKGDGKETYYRLDFINRDTQIANIARNYKYIFSINNVSASGFSSEDDAIDDLKASNALDKEVTGSWMVIVDEDIMDITTDGTNYLGVTSAKIDSGKNNEYYYANFSVVCNNTVKGWEMITSEFPAGVTVSQTSHIPTLAEVNTAVSVWIYIEKDKVAAGKVIDVFIYCGSIRKKIEVIIPKI